MNELNLILFLLKCTLLLAGVTIALFWGLNRKVGLQRTKAIFGKLILLSFALGLALVTAEVAVRILFHDVTTTSDNKSYFAQRWARMEKSVENELGFRERPIPPTKQKGVRRIAVIGDSFTWGQGIPEDKRFTNLLEKGLTPAGSFEVLNFGTAGHEMQHHIQTLTDVVFKLEPDFVLLQWFGNDVESEDKSNRPQYKKLLPSAVLSNFLFHHSALYYVLNVRWRALQEKLGWAAPYTSYLEKYYGDPESPDSQRAANELRRFIQTCRNRGVPLGIVAFPRLDDPAAGAFLLERVLTTCQEENIPCLDLRPPLGAVTPPSRLWVNRFDNHPGILANQIVADALVPFISDSFDF